MKKKSFIVILILLILVILGLVCYIAYDKGVFNSFLKKESNIKDEKKNTAENGIDKNIEEEKVEELDVNSAEVVNLIKQFDILNSQINSGSGSIFARMYKSDKVTVDDLSDAEKGYIAISNIVEVTGGSQEISAVDTENMVKKIFGNINYTNGDIPAYGCAFGKISYIASSNIYKTSDTGCGGVCDRTVQYKIVKAVKNGDIINITVAIAYVDCDIREINGITEVYSLFYSDLNAQNKVYEDPKSGNFNFDKYINNTTKYTYTFKQDGNNNYVFTKVEKE